MKRFAALTTPFGWVALAASVAVGSGYYGDQPGWLSLFLAAVGCVLLTPVFWSNGSPAGRTFGAVTALAGVVLWRHESTHLPAGLFLLAGAINLAAIERSRLNSMARAAAFSALLLAIGIAAGPLWIRFEASQPDCAVLERFLAAILSFVGIDAARTDERLYVDVAWGSVGVVIDPMKLGGLIAALYIVFDLLHTTLTLGWKRAFVRAPMIGAALLAFGLLRITVSSLFGALTSTVVVLIHPILNLIGWFPFLLAVGLTSRPLDDEPSPAALSRTSRALGWSSLVAGSFLTAFALFYHDVGEAVKGRVVMDEAHSEWELASKPFDREHWGRGSTYNYAGLADLLDRHYDFSLHSKGSIDAKLLDGAQVLILKTPTRPFEKDEVRTILDFARGGGGVWLIGDHTNLFGMSDSLNEIAVPAGLRFVNDATYEAYSGWMNHVVDKWPRHPAGALSAGMDYQTSCSIVPMRSGVEPILTGRYLASEMADYGHPNFFGNMQTELEDRVGTFYQAAAVTFGAGRVAAFSDSTILSNFSLFEPGVSEMALRTTAYLSTRPVLPEGWRTTAFLIGFILIGAGLVAVAATKRDAAIAGLSLLASALTVYVGNLDDRSVRSLGIEPTKRPYRVVSFVEDASSFKRTAFIEEAQSPFQGDLRGNPESINTLYAWMLRLPDTRPRRDESVSTALRRGANLVVVFEPRREPTSEEVSLLTNYVARGGGLLVADDLTNRRTSKSDAWLRSFGLSMTTESAERTLEFAGRAHSLDLVATSGILAPIGLVTDALLPVAPRKIGAAGRTFGPHSLSVKGGDALMVDDAGAVVAARAFFGEGVVAGYARSFGLTNAVLGGRYDPEPGPESLERHRAALSLFETIIDVVRPAAGSSR